MRCMVCGEEKVLAEAMPAEDMAVPGFEYQTLECPGCDDTERRLLFTGRVTGFARRATETGAPSSQPHQTEQDVEVPASSDAANPETISNGSSVEISTAEAREEEPSPGEGVTEFTGGVTERVIPEADPPVVTQEPDATAGSNISVQAWLRAVEKLRSYQTDLHLRAEEAKRRNWNIEFDIAWDSFAFPRQRLLAGHPRNILQSHRERLRRKRLSIASAPRSHPPEPAQECDTEAVRRFDEFWNSLAAENPRRTESSAPPASVAVLPTSLVNLLKAVEGAVLSR
jgi:hypothetical protein